MLTVLFLLVAGVSLVQAHAPQVYENVDDTIKITSNRQARDPFHPRQSTIAFQAPVFDYKKSIQQDHRQSRYAQQQEIDVKNIFGKSDIVPEMTPPNKYTPKTTVQTQVSPHHKRTSRRLVPINKNIKRQDTDNVIYVDPELIKAHFKDRHSNEEELQALNALIGQHPSQQLQGLQRILQSNPKPFQIAVKDHTPIKEDNQEESLSHNIDIKSLMKQHGTIESIQAQLDQVAQLEAEKALKHAEEQARAHVEAQHQTILRQQTNLQKAALAKIAFHNQPQSTSNYQEYQGPISLPLRSEPLPYALAHSHQVQEQPQNVVYYKAEEQQTAAGQANAPTDSIIHIVPKKSKISVTKTHSLTQQRRLPSGYKEQVVVETQHKLLPAPSSQVYQTLGQKAPSVQAVPEHAEDDAHYDTDQYASRYAFGYKIKDVKKGNDFGHEEKRDGKSAKGHYHVLLPDGRLQKVEYYADPSGYHAKVTYENLAHH